MGHIADEIISRHFPPEYWPRVYTGADETEAYFAIPGWQLRLVEEQLAVMVRANQALEQFHRGRAAATPTT